jgi:multidrug resistance protein MdtO
MPNVTSIGGLMGVVFVAALVSGWIAAGGPRISYAGFQLAFAFLLCVVQGAAPAFDMTIARDRTIGIFFGDIVVAIVFTQIWPVTIAGRIDPALRALLRQVATLASAAGMAQRWQLAAALRTKLAAFEQDLALSRYEPLTIRPVGAWLDERRQIAHTLSSLQGPLLIAADEGSAAFAGIAHRLDRLADGNGVAQTSAESNAISMAVEAPLARLEQLVEHLSEHSLSGTADYARA